MTFLFIGKTFDIIELSEKFLSRQAKQIAKYGEKNTVVRVGVTDEMLNVLTPYRRTSNKPCQLSDNKWFIANFKNKRGNEYLPKNWADFSETEKVDYIVKDRYQSLVSNKIMNIIKEEPIEHSFGVSKNGEVIFYDSGTINKAETIQFKNYNEIQATIKNAHLEKKIECADIGIHIHNHPSFKQPFLDPEKKKRDFRIMEVDNINKYGSAFSGQDMYNFMLFDCQGRVVDALGHKFSFIPKSANVKRHDYAESITKYFDDIWKNKIFAKKELSSLKKLCNQKMKDYEDYIKTSNYDVSVARKKLQEYLALDKEITLKTKSLPEQKELFGNDKIIEEYFGKWSCIS